MKNIVKMFIFMLLTITNVNLVSAMEKAGGAATRLSGVVLHDISTNARDKHVNAMYDFVRSKTLSPEELALAIRNGDVTSAHDFMRDRISADIDLLAHRRAKTAAMFEKFTKTYIAPRSKSAGTGAEERKD